MFLCILRRKVFFTEVKPFPENSVNQILVGQ